MKWMKWTLLSAAALLLAASCANPAGSDKNSEPAFTGTSQYFIFGSAIAYTSTTGINVTVYDSKDSYKKITSATVTVDGQNLPIEGSTYFLNVSSVWPAGTTHTFKIKTPDGQSFSGTVVMPTGTLSGPTYSPAKGTLASRYTVSMPAGANWPTGAYITATVTDADADRVFSSQPTGSAAAVFEQEQFASATKVAFTSCISTSFTVSGYQNNSVFDVSGVSTSW